MARWGLPLAPLVLLLSLGVCRAQEDRVQVNDDTLVPVVTPPISFFWSLGDDDLQQKAIRRCSSPLSLAIDNTQAAASTTFPLYMTVFPVGRQPTTQLVLDGPNLTFFQWDANLPVGTNFSIGMTDSSSPANSGGTVDGFYISEGFNNCTDAPQATNALNVTIDPTDTACGELDLDIEGGQEPYTVSVLSGLSGLYGNLTGIVGDSVKLRNTVPSGQHFTLFVTDVNGLSSNVSDRMTSALGSPTCNTPAPDEDNSSEDNSAPLGAIIGGAVGGVVAAVLLALLAWWLLRRRSDKANQRYREEELATKGEFRMADGTVPLVQPFVVPQQRSSEYAESTSPTSAHPSFSPHDYPYASSHTTPPPLPQSAYSNSQPSPTSPNSQHTSYPSYGDESTYRSHSYEPTAASSTVDGLANPEEFAYRDAGTWVSNGQTPSLPPGAQRPNP